MNNAPRFRKPCPRCQGRPFGRTGVCRRCNGAGSVSTSQCPSGCARGWVGQIGYRGGLASALSFGKCKVCNP